MAIRNLERYSAYPKHERVCTFKARILVYTPVCAFVCHESLLYMEPLLEESSGYDYVPHGVLRLNLCHRKPK